MNRPDVGDLNFTCYRCGAEYPFPAYVCQHCDGRVCENCWYNKELMFEYHPDLKEMYD